MVGRIIGAFLCLAILAAIGTAMLVSEKKRHSLFPDDGIVWNTAIEKRMTEARNGSADNQK